MADRAGEMKRNEQQSPAGMLHVGVWRVDPQANGIAQDGEEVRLEPKVMEVLMCLVDRAGEVVTKKQFMARVWGDTVVTNDVLSRCISELRKVLGDDARNPSYVETIRKRGYRLVAPVRREKLGNDSLDERARTNGASANGASVNGVPASGARADGARADGASANGVPAAEPGVAASEAAASKVAADESASAASAAERGRRVMQAVLARQARRAQQRWPWLAAGAAVLVLVGVLRAAEPPASDEAVTLPQTVPFTSFPGEELDSELAPDGERVAFAWGGGDGANTDIYVKQPGAAEPLRITDHPAPERSPTWSPNGRRLAFVRSTPEEHSVIIAPAIGGGEQRVARLGERKVQALDWSPDGSQLAMTAQEEPYGAYSVYLLALDSLTPRQLTAPPDYYHGDLDPAFSPDGEHVAFVRSVVEHVQDVYTVPVDGGEPRRLTHDDAEVGGLDWMAEGRRIVFASDREGASRLWSIPAEGGAPQWLPAGGGSGAYQPSVARAGRRMTFTERSHDLNIWRLKPVTGASGLSSHRAIFSTRWDSNPDIAPGGEHVAFASKRSGSFEIWISRADGTDPVQLTDFGGPFTSTPRWAPDGERLAFASRADGNADVYVTGTGGGRPRPLTQAPADEVAPRWSRDGGSVYFASNRSGAWQIWRRSLAGDTLQQVTHRGGFAAQEPVDGPQLFYVKKSEPGLWRRSTTAGDTAEVRLVADLGPRDWGNWAATEHGLYYVRRLPEGPMLSFYNFATERTTPVAELEGLPHHPSLAVAPGAAWFLFSKEERRESDIMLVENFR